MQLPFDHSFEELSPTLSVCVTPEHKFGTDAFLLSHYAGIRRKDRAVDLGTGCGIVALLWFRQPALAPREAWCVDIQPQAICQLEETVRRYGLEGRVHPVCADLKELKGKVPFGCFDVVTCNPPYKAENSGIRNQQDSHTIARHEVACNIQDICATAARLLQTGGRFCLCQRPERLTDTLAAMQQAHLEPKRLRFVQKLGNTAPWLFLVEARKDGRPGGLKVEAPLLIQDGNGAFSQELQQIYRGQ